MDDFSFGEIPVDGAALSALEHDIHHRFGQVKLLALALAHSSWANDQGRPGQNNERLEFLGDAVLELSITDEAYRRYPQANEGELTKLRSRLVKAPTLAGVARAAGLDRHVLLGRGEEAQGGRDRDSLTITLLSDPDRSVMKQWGAFGEKKLYGKIVEGVIRSTFVVSPTGEISYAAYNVKATGHVAKLRKDLGI